MADRNTYLLVDGENIDATLGSSILGRRPSSDERPRWDRLSSYFRDKWGQPVVGLFFLAANHELPMPFLQALIAMGYRPVPLSGGADEKVVDIAILRTLEALLGREGDVALVSNDGDFVGALGALGNGRRRAVVGFNEFRNRGFDDLAGVELLDLEYDVKAFTQRLPRLRVIPISEFDPLEFL